VSTPRRRGPGKKAALVHESLMLPAHVKDFYETFPIKTAEMRRVLTLYAEGKLKPTD